MRLLDNKPTLHDFRRAFALNMLRNGVDIFALQRLMGHSDLQIMRRYLAQNNEDNQLAHMRGSPVDNNL
jgi:integrase